MSNKVHKFGLFALMLLPMLGGGTVPTIENPSNSFKKDYNKELVKSLASSVGFSGKFSVALWGSDEDIQTSHVANRFHAFNVSNDAGKTVRTFVAVGYTDGVFNLVEVDNDEADLKTGKENDYFLLPKLKSPENNAYCYGKTVEDLLSLNSDDLMSYKSKCQLSTYIEMKLFSLLNMNANTMASNPPVAVTALSYIPDLSSTVNPTLEAYSGKGLILVGFGSESFTHWDLNIDLFNLSKSISNNMSSYGGAVVKLSFDLNMIDQGAIDLPSHTIIELDQKHNDGAFAVTNIFPNIVIDNDIIVNTAALIQRTKLTTFSQYGLGMKLVVSDDQAAPVPTTTPDTLESLIGIKNNDEIEQEIYGYEPFGEAIPGEITIKDNGGDYPSVYALYDLGLFLGYPDGQVSKITLETTGYGMDAEPILRNGGAFQTEGEVPISYITYNNATQDLLIASDSNSDEIYAFHYLSDNKSQRANEKLSVKLREALGIASSSDLPLLVSSASVNDATYVLFDDASVVKLSFNNETAAYEIIKIANTGSTLELKDVQEIAVSEAQDYLALVNLETNSKGEPLSYRMLLHHLNNNTLAPGPEEVFKGFKHMVSNVTFSKDELGKDSLSFTLAKQGFIQPNDYQEILGGVTYGALYNYDIQAQKLINPSTNVLCYVEAEHYRDSSENAKLSRVQQGFCYVPSTDYPEK